MIDSRVKKSLRPVGRRLRLLRFTQWTLIAWTVAAVFGLLLWHQANTDPAAPPVTGWQVISVGFAGTALAILVAMLSGWNVQSLASRVETAFPQLKQRLLTAMSQRPDQDGRFGYLQRVVIDQTLVHARTHQWVNAVPPSRIMACSLAILPAVACAILIAYQIGWSLPSGIAEASSERQERLVQDGEVLVEPGDAEIERGNSLVITARFGIRVPREATLVLRAGEQEQRLAMKRSLDDPLFAASIDRIDGAISYQIESNVANSDAFQISVFEFPELQRADAELQFPSYTGLPDKIVEDTLRVSAVEGTELTWICQLNKSVQRAWLEDESAGSEEDLVLEADDENAGHYRAAIKLSETRRWTLHLEDTEGRRNKFPPRLIARVLPNKPPELKLAAARDVRVSPLEELPLKATVRDDYGIVRAGLGYSIPGKSEGEILLGESIDRMNQHELIHQIDFEALEAEPDQLLSYYFWAEDMGPDGEIRRTSGDMFFAEVRPFEEIFREGQSPPGGSEESESGPQGGNAEDAEKLAELQKQVVIATWALVRRELREEGSEAFVDDVDAIAEAQTTAKEMLAELAGELSDPQSIEFAGAAEDLMQEVLEQLTTAEQKNLTAPMDDALSSAQAAYQALLRLRDREFQVVQSQQSQSSSSSSSASRRQMQQQLDQLELNNDQNRYEAEQQAQANEEDPQQEAMRKVLSRLSELARRQQDLNKQIQELQSALQAAETEKEKEEVARLLKRLREQQQELLRDTDELSQRMQESASDSNALQEAQQKLEQTRENVRQASEALGEEDASQALNAGTRAEREFNEMRESVRQETTGQFNDTMREMRQEARDLEAQQQTLAEQMRQEEEAPDVSQGLRGSAERGETKEAMAEQTERLKDLLQQMQDTIERSEEIEPMLAEKLYESFRQAQRDQTEQRLDFTAELLERGLTPQALQMEEEARRGIERLREGVEDAAESVIGDETEGLRRASARLERLAEAVNQEIREATGEPQGSDQQDDQQQPDGQQPNGQQSDGQQPNGQPQDGQPQDGDSQSGQQSDGQQPDGQPTDSQQPANQPQGGQQPGGQPQEGQQPGGQPQEGQQPGGQQPSGQQPGGQPQRGQTASPSGGSASGGGARQDGQGSLLDQGNWTGSEEDAPIAAPLTGEGFREWSDAMRDVEQLVEDSDLRSEAARIRERARDMRREWNRHASEPEWPLVTEMIAEPLERLRMQVSEELIRRSAEKNAVVPIDRDPVPDRFTEAVRDYYERIGSGQ